LTAREKLQQGGRHCRSASYVKQQRSYLSTGVRVNRRQWDNGIVTMHPKKIEYNAMVAKKVAEVEKIILGMEMEEVRMTIENFRERLPRNKKKEQRDFLDWMHERWRSAC
jgi:hypothetical protein